MSNKKNDRTDSPVNTSRRDFIKGFGATSLGAVATGHGLLGSLEACTSATGSSQTLGPGPSDVTLLVNGRRHSIRIEPRTTLVEALRDKLGLTGTKIGCDRGACGACTVLVEGKSVCSCMTLAIDAVGKSVETIEGVAADRRLAPIQEAFIETDAMQCGFCTSGMLMSCKALLDANPSPSHDEIKKSVSGNLCRCGTYPKVFEAVERATKMKG